MMIKVLQFESNYCKTRTCRKGQSQSQCKGDSVIFVFLVRFLVHNHSCIGSLWKWGFPSQFNRWWIYVSYAENGFKQTCPLFSNAKFFPRKWPFTESLNPANTKQLLYSGGRSCYEVYKSIISSSLTWQSRELHVILAVINLSGSLYTKIPPF